MKENEKNNERSHGRNTEIYESTLRTRDPVFSHIIVSSMHVVIYRYNGSSWTKADIEGPLYIYKRRDIPSTAVFVMNRKSPIDLHLFLDEKLTDPELHNDFVVIKRSTENKIEIYGMWFHNALDAETTYNTLRTTVTTHIKTKSLEKMIRKVIIN